MRICLVHGDCQPTPGPTHGIPRYLQQLAAGLAACGHEVEMLAGEAAGQPEAGGHEAATGGVAIHRARPWRPRLPGLWRLNRHVPFDHWCRSVGFARALCSSDLRGRYALVECAEFRGEGLSYIFRRRRCPVVVRVHHLRLRTAQVNQEPSTPYVRLVHRMEMAAIRRADGVTVPSRAALAMVAEHVDLDPLALSVIPNPVDTDRFRPRAETPRKHLLFAGRLEPRKGADVLAAALPILRRRFPALPLVVAGAEGHFPAFAREVRERLGQDPHVRMAGAVGQDALVRLYQQALCTLVPSRDETFCYAAAESMACGTPVVAARAGALPELVTEGREGMLCEAGDARGLADAVIKLVEDESLRTGMGAAARRRAEGEWTAPVIAARTVAFYQKILALSLTKRGGPGVEEQRCESL